MRRECLQVSTKKVMIALGIVALLGYTLLHSRR